MKQPILERFYHHGFEYSVWIVFSLIVLFGWQKVLAQTRQDSRLVTVEELMQLDAQAALRLARRHLLDEPPINAIRTHPGGQQSEAAYVKDSATPIVQAIYGIGRALTAEIHVGQEVHILDGRHKRRSGMQGSVLVLERIEPPCVHIKKDDQKEVLCLQQVRP